MKKKLFLFIIIGLLLIPFGVNASSKKILDEYYETKNFTETLEDEGIEKEFSNYQENDDKITIYLFRGKGCPYCKAYLSFMNSITNEYGKYFNMVSFEVWQNENNWNLMQRTSYYLKNEMAGGVPYIIIGDKVFQGFTEGFEEDIKNSIVNLYNTSKNERYDVFKNAEKDGLISIEELKKMYETENEENQNTYKTTSNNSSNSNTPIILWNLLFIAIGTTLVILFNNYKFNSLRKDILKSNNIEKKENRIKSKRK